MGSSRHPPQQTRTRAWWEPQKPQGSPANEETAPLSIIPAAWTGATRAHVGPQRCGMGVRSTLFSRAGTRQPSRDGPGRVHAHVPPPDTHSPAPSGAQGRVRDAGGTGPLLTPVSTRASTPRGAQPRALQAARTAPTTQTAQGTSAHGPSCTHTRAAQRRTQVARTHLGREPGLSQDRSLEHTPGSTSPAVQAGAHTRVQTTRTRTHPASRAHSFPQGTRLPSPSAAEPGVGREMGVRTGPTRGARTCLSPRARDLHILPAFRPEDSPPTPTAHQSNEGYTGARRRAPRDARDLTLACREPAATLGRRLLGRRGAGAAGALMRGCAEEDRAPAVRGDVLQRAGRGLACRCIVTPTWGGSKVGRRAAGAHPTYKVRTLRRQTR